MADAPRLILDHEDQLDLLTRSAHTEPDDFVVALKKVGGELRKARELKREQLGDASRAVNIHPHYLAAIEDGRLEDLPGRAFTIGYLARYARHLGVDVENVVDRLQGKIASGNAALDDDIEIVPLPDRRFRPAVIAIALLALVAATYSANELVGLATRTYEVAKKDPAQRAVDPPSAADEQTAVAVAPAVPPPARIAVTPRASLRADLTPAAIEQARIAAIPLPARIAVTPLASLRADLTPAAIEEARIAAMPLPARIAVTPSASLRADLTPAAIREQTRVAALFPMPLPAGIAVTLPAALRPDLEPAAIKRALAMEAIIAGMPLPAQVEVTSPASLRADVAQTAQAQLPSGHQLGATNRSSRITLRVHGPTFVAVRDARSRIFLERRLVPGDTYRVPDRANLRLTARDGGAVEIILDGTSIGFAGSHGLQTNELALNPQTIANRLSRF